METGGITTYIDVAQVTLYIFFAFFFGLIFYLRREDKREGYPLVGDGQTQGFPPLPSPKTFLLPHGGSVQAPRRDDVPEPNVLAAPTASWPGAPLSPTGDPLLSAAGPSAYTMRSDEPELTFEHNLPRIQPMRVATEFSAYDDGSDPRGFEVIGADGAGGGWVHDMWIDRLDTMVRYLEVSLLEGGTVLMPMTLAVVSPDSKKVYAASIKSTQFAGVPRLARPDLVSLREEDRISAYWAGGHLYADPQRTEPLI